MNNAYISEKFRSADLLSYPDEKFICFIDNNGKAGFKVNGGIVIAPIYDFVEPFYEGLALVRIDDKYQYINKQGVKFADANSTYTYPEQRAEGVILLHCKTHNFEIDTIAQYRFLEISSGEEICAMRFDTASPFSEGIACVCKGDKWGYINVDGTIVIPFKYEAANSFREGLASVKLNDAWGVINKHGDIVVDFIYDHVEDFYDGMADIKLNGKYGFVDKYGIEIVSPKYDDVYPYSSGVADVRTYDSGYALIDRTGEAITPFKYDAINDDREWVDEVGVVMINIEKNGETVERYGLINTSGKEIAPTIYDWVEQPAEGRMLVVRNKKIGFLDISGAEIIPTIYDGALPFSCGLALVVKDSLCGYIDYKGKFIIPLRYQHAYPFVDGVALVKLNGNTHLINTKNEIIKTLDYDEVLFDFFDMTSVRIGDKYGTINLKGELLLPVVYEAIGGPKNRRKDSVKIGKKWYDIDNLGNIYGEKYLPIKIDLTEDAPF